ncbi:MAG: cobalamin-dependent protein, partial [Candidatus Eisenbacteria bacterium]
MRAVLVGPEIEENLSVRYLAAALEQAGHQAEVIPFNRTADVGRVTRAVLRRQPPLVGLSLVAQRRYSDYQRLVESLRAGGYRGHIVAGGHFASLRATEVLRDTPGLDTILHHEGEVRLLRLIEWLEARGAGAPTFDGITWRAADRSLRHRAPERVAPLDSLAPPLRKRPDTTLGHRRAPLVASRGCAGQCSFCSISAWHAQVKKARLRLRSAQAVAAEMITLDRERDVRVFVFHDDDFLLPDPKKALARCEEILGTARRGIGRPFAFVLKCRPDDVEPELFAYLGRMGLVRAYVGIETHAPTGLTTLNRRVTQEENERALRVFDQLGLYACFNLLIFDPDSTVAAIEENLRFLRTQLHRPFDVARTELYAGAALEDRMRREGRARGDYRGYDYSIADPRVESMFQLFADVLWERHFGGGSMLHRSQDLGYRLSLCRRLHPEVVRPALAGEIQALIEEVNRDTVTYFERLLARSLEGALDTPARDRFVHEMR